MRIFCKSQPNSHKLLTETFINFANDWIRTLDLYYQKQPLYQLSHNPSLKF